EAILNEHLAQKQLHRHPRVGGRSGERFGLHAPDAKEYLKTELAEVFGRLEQLGFNRPQIRAGALELLHDEEWAPEPPQPRAPARARLSEATQGDVLGGEQSPPPAPQPHSGPAQHTPPGPQP